MQWAIPGNTAEPPTALQACGIAGRLRVIYALDAKPILATKFKPQSTYPLTHFDPVTGTRTDPTDIQATPADETRVAPPAYGHDWVILLEFGTRAAETERH